MANEVKLTFAGDSKSLDRAFDNVGKSSIDMSKDVAKAETRLDGFNDSAEGLTKNSRGAKDVLDGFSDSMEALGVTLPGPLGNIAGMAGGVADMADGMGTLAAPAIAKMSTAMKALNLTFLTSPIGITIAAIIALSVAFVVAYKKSEKFRAFVHAALDGVKQIAVDVKDAFWAMANGIGAAFNFIADKAEWLWKYSPLGLLVTNLDRLGGAIGKVGGALHIPGFASGGQTSGLSVVGERGPELFAGKGTVIPNGRLGGGGETRVIVELRGSGDPIMEAIKKQVRVRGGGNVQLALGGMR